jgi:hypothetical protein
VRRTIGCAWVVLLLALPACSSGTKADAGPTASVTAPSTTADPQAAVKAEVEAAYLKSWEDYTRAIRVLDVSLLTSSYADDALDTRRHEFEELRQAGQAAAMRVEHGPLQIQLDGSRAMVEDTYRNHSVLVDPATGAPLEPDPNNVLRRRYTLERRGSVWVVIYVLGL